MNSSSFKQWRGGIGSRWHLRIAGYSGHIVQVVNDFGDLVAVSGQCRRVRLARYVMKYARKVGAA